MVVTGTLISVWCLVGPYSNHNIRSLSHNNVICSCAKISWYFGLCFSDCIRLMRHCSIQVFDSSFHTNIEIEEFVTSSSFDAISSSWRQASRYNLLFHTCFSSVICKLFSIDLILSSSADCRTHGVKRKHGFLLLPYNLSPSIYFWSRQALPFNSYLWYERTTKVYFTNSVQLNLNIVILALTRRALFSGRKDDNISRTKEKETG